MICGHKKTRLFQFSPRKKCYMHIFLMATKSLSEAENIAKLLLDNTVPESVTDSSENAAKMANSILTLVYPYF